MKKNEFAAVDKLKAKQEEKFAYTFLSPALLYLISFYIVPLLMLFFWSFYRNIPGGGTEYIFSLENYKKFITDPYYYTIIWRSLRLGLTVTIITMFLGYPFAYYMTYVNQRFKSICYILVLMPLLTSVVVRTYGWMVLLGQQGVLTNIVNIFGREGPLMYSSFGVHIALIHIFLPFMVLSIQAVLENIDKSLLLAAQGLGATKLRAFLFVTLPLSMPGVVAGSILVFALSLAAFVTPTLIGGPSFRVVPGLIYEQAMASLDWPFGAAVAFTFLFIVMTIVYAYNYLTGRLIGTSYRK